MKRIQQQHQLTDPYYTSHDVIDQYVDLIKVHIDFQDLWVVDCSCGDNYFAHQMQLPHISIDIHPKDCFVSQDTQQLLTGDFLQTSLQLPDKEFLFGFNPPFGLRNRLTKKFLRKIFHYKPKYMALILLTPTNKQGWNFQGYQTLVESPVPKNAFIYHGTSMDVPCTFYLLERVQAPPKTPTFLPRKKHYHMKNEVFRVERNKTSTPSPYGVATRFLGAYAGNQ